jgi:lysine-specific demethylase 6A
MQYKLAIDRHDYYRHERYQSIVPMIHLSWNLARHRVPITDGKLVTELRTFLSRSLKYCSEALLCASRMGRAVVWHGRVEGEAAHYCEHCQVRLLFFNISSA